MNRFFKKDKPPVEENVIAKKPRKGKKEEVEEEVKPDFDLSSALPKVDDFRTSLIMPGLSTRFSMLREQDDPNSKLGKACDDSVLQTKRQSRLHEFGFNSGGLSDIAEVSSIKSSIRPPFASDRDSSYDTHKSEDDSGSIMTRSRPGEGNVLFGGRQKIYMISNNTKGTGRALYDDDVNMSAYQRLRREEKERLRNLQTEDQKDLPSEPSSPTALSRKRDTSSSTDSSPTDARISTGATSIASQDTNSASASSSACPPVAAPTSISDANRSTAKVRRLYDQGLDQHIQDQQSSSINRLNSLRRARAPSVRSNSSSPLSHAKSATNLSDRFQRGPVFHAESMKPLGYPSVSRNNSSAGSSPVIPSTQSAPSASPVVSDNEDSFSLNAILQPHDRGKATAMGAFNKPKEAFSEQQYEERLKQMQQGGDIREVPVSTTETSSSRKPTLRERAETDASEQKSSGSSAGQNQPAAAFSVFQAAASQMKTAATTLPNQPHPSSQNDASQNLYTGSTFLHSRDSSNDAEACPPTISRSEVARRFENLPVATGPAPSIFEHPALRSYNAPEEILGLTMSATHSQNTSPNPSTQLKVPSPVNDMGIDSPTLGPNNGGLSGLIRQHLRNNSNISSNDGDNDKSLSGSETTKPVPYNPWDLDEIDNVYHDQRGSGSSAGQLTLNTLSDTSSSRWDSTRRNHERIASNETEIEHEAFQRDLAYRQRLIQENLRAKAEGRSTSPAPGSAGGLRTALNMLRAKSSYESFATVERQPDGSNKSTRKLVLGANSANISSISLAGSNTSDQWRAEMPSLRKKPSRALQQNEQDAHHQSENPPRSPSNNSTRAGRLAGQSPPVSSRSSTRERSSSGTSSGRSRGRSGYRRDDPEQPATEDVRSTAYPPTLPEYAAHSIPGNRPSLDSEGRVRSRSNSRPSAANQLNGKHLQPLQTSGGSANIPSRFALPSGFTQGKYSPISPRPSAGGYDNTNLNAVLSPASPASNSTIPNVVVFNPSTVQPVRQGVLRKKSIVKGDISEPVFLSTTSVIDLVNLPPGVSLKNGAETDAPPVPPINPMRRRFGFGRSENQSLPHDTPGPDASRAPYTEQMRTNSSDGLASPIPQPKSRLRKASSEGRSLHGQALRQTGPVPAMPSTNFIGRHNSPPHPMHDQHMAQRPMDGAMF